MRRKAFSRGQSLVEYALLLGLVAIAVIVILVALGLGLQRVYGLVAGALGGHQDEHAKHTITIDSALCIAVAAAPGQQARTGLWVVGQTDEPLNTVTGTNEVGTSVVAPYNGGYVFQPIVDANKADVGECPASVVIQATDGTIAAAPLVRVSG